MTLDRQRVDRIAGAHIRTLQRLGNVSDAEKRRIRTMHERIATKVDRKKR